MEIVKEYCKIKYYSEFNSDSLLSEVQEKVSSDITYNEPIKLTHKTEI